MAVIINEFEVSIVTPIQVHPPKKEEPARPAKAPPPLKPVDVADIVRRFAERRDRLRAF